jgi:hypothetical protein
VRHKDVRSDGVLALLSGWVVAAGGRIERGVALLPALPHRYATLELRRMLRRSGLEIREGDAAVAAAKGAATIAIQDTYDLSLPEP